MVADNHKLTQGELVHGTLPGLSDAVGTTDPHLTIDDRFELVRKLGSGAAGTVFEGIQLAVGRQVAIKLLHPTNHDQHTYRCRFEREARAVARLNHPHCITLYDFGFSEQVGTHFIVMEYVDGKTLHEWSEHTSPSLPKLLEVMCQVTSALDHAHERGILHRDLKPENVLITSDDQVRVLDFGLARLGDELGSQPGSSNRLTQPGNIYGTPAYMSPEQCRGDLELSAASDLYAIGVILFELLEGQLPYQPRRIIDVLIKHVSAPIPPLSDPELPEALCDLVAQLLAKQPDERPASAAEVTRTLEAVIEQLKGRQKEGPEQPSVAENSDSELPDSQDSTDGTDEPERTAMIARIPAVETVPGLVSPYASKRSNVLVALATAAVCLSAAALFQFFDRAPDAPGSAAAQVSQRVEGAAGASQAPPAEPEQRREQLEHREFYHPATRSELRNLPASQGEPTGVAATSAKSSPSLGDEVSVGDEAAGGKEVSADDEARAPSPPKPRSPRRAASPSKPAQVHARRAEPRRASHRTAKAEDDVSARASAPGADQPSPQTAPGATRGQSDDEPAKDDAQLETLPFSL